MTPSTLYYKCVQCGRPTEISTAWNIAGLIEKRLCTECNHWMDVSNLDQTDLWVINGELFELRRYHAQDPKESNGLVELWYVLTENTAFIADTLYNYGKIPHRFTHLFKNHARFIKLNEYNKFRKHPKYRCKRKGCFSRANCWWYEGEMNFNRIPRSNKLNPEDCPNFIRSIKPKK